MNVREPCAEGVIRAGDVAATSSEHSNSTQRWVLAATILGSGITFIDGTVVNVALPVLQRELGAGVGAAQWVVESYALMLAALILVGGAAGDRFGRRRIFSIGVAVFAAASLWCGLAPGVTQLITARTVQGIGAALLVPESLALISASFPKEERGRAIGTWSGFTAIAAGFGPVLGGWLIEHVSWRWVFYINLPLAAVVLLIAWRRVPESRDEAANKSLDLTGASLVTIGLGALVFGLIEAGTRGFQSTLIIISFFAGIAALMLFVFVEKRRGEAAMMPLALFSSKTFAGANLLTFFLYAALGGLLFFLPYDLLEVQGYSATQTGAALLPFVLMMFTLSRWAGGLTNRYGVRRPLIAGPLVAAIGFALFALPSAYAGSYWTSFFPAVMVMSLGMSASVAPLTMTVMSAVAENRVGLASGINNAVSRTASLVAVAALGLVMLSAFNGRLTNKLDSFAARINPSIRAEVDSQRDRLAGIVVPPSADTEAKQMIERSVNESFIAGFRLVAIVAGALGVVSSLCAYLLIEDEPAAKKREL